MPSLGASLPKPASEKESVVLRLRLPTEGGLPDEALGAIVAELAKANPQTHRCVVVVFEHGDLSTRALHLILTNVLLKTMQLPGNGALVLLFPTIRAPQLLAAAGLARDMLHSEVAGERNQTIATSAPVLLLGLEGTPIWLGGTLETREILDLLCQKGDMPWDDLRSSIRLHTDTELRHRLRDLADIIQHDAPDTYSLRYPIAGINKFLAHYYAAEIQRLVEAGETPHVHSGCFRTPSLKFVTRWISVAPLLADRLGLAAATYTLARNMEPVLGADCRFDARLVQVDSGSAGIARLLAQNLQLELSEYTAPSGVEGDWDFDVLPSPGSRSVILCADVIASGNTVARALKALRRSGFSVRAIACMIDARGHGSTDIKGVPVISLVNVDIALPEPSVTPIDIDPILRRPLSPLSQRVDDIKYPCPREQILNACATGADGAFLYFGHIARDIGRHFTTYLNARQLLFGTESLGPQILDSFVEYTLQGIQGLGSGHLQLWYPGPDDDIAGQLAVHITKEVTRLAPPGLALLSPRGIPRSAYMGRWVFPQALPDVPPNTHVVMVDWGSITTNTVQQAMRLAAQAGAASFRAIVFLSQMPTEDELALRRIRSIHRAVLSPSDSMSLFEVAEEISTKEARADVVFLSTLHLGFYAPRTCPICRIRRLLISEEPHCPSRILREHMRRAGTLLKEKDRADVFAEPPRDLCGVPLSTAAISDLVRVRHELEAAVRSTAKRWEVLATLQTLATSGLQQDQLAWIRLLATEPGWLKAPPLCFADLRLLLAQLGLRLALDSDNSLSTGERQQACIVIRAASKETFVRELPRLFTAAVTCPELLSQVLFDAYTYLRKPYHDTKTDLNVLQQSLAQCRDALTSASALPNNAEYMSTLRALNRLALLLMSHPESSSYAPRDAWKMLHETYFRALTSHHVIVERTFDISIPLWQPKPPIDSGALSAMWARAADAWEQCQDFLTSNVFPYLSAVRELVCHEYYSTQVPSAAVKRLYVLLQDDTLPAAGRRLVELLADFARDPTSFEIAEKQQEARTEWLWWYDLFFRTGGQSTSASNSLSTFLRLLRDCPASLLQAYEYACNHVRQKGYVFTVDPTTHVEDSLVFCDRMLLCDTLSHVIQNAVEEKHRRPGCSGEVRVRCTSATEEAGRVLFTVYNTETMVTDPPGRGLEQLNGYLAGFGAHVTGKACTDTHWTYVAECLFLGW